MSAPRLPLALKFGLALFAVVAGGLVIVYLAVVPRLESRLVAAKVDELEHDAPGVIAQFERGNPLTDYQLIAQNVSAQDYFIGAFIDSDSAVTETNEFNNTVVSRCRVTPGLSTICD